MKKVAINRRSDLPETTVHVTIPREVGEVLKATARKEGRIFSAYLRDLLVDYASSSGTIQQMTVKE